MPAKSFIGTMEVAARQFYATAMRGEVSDANVRGYLRAAGQIADIWQQIDQRIADVLVQGSPPWEAYRRIATHSPSSVRPGPTRSSFVSSWLQTPLRTPRLLASSRR